MAFNAPFGTDVQPGIDIKIVAGRQVEVHREKLQQNELRRLKRSSPVLRSTPQTIYSPPWAFNDNLPKTPPRKVLKPITETDSSGDEVLEDRHVPFTGSSTVLPPIQGSSPRKGGSPKKGRDSEEERFLEESLNSMLKNYEQRRLKELYIAMTMTNFDPKLTGYVSPAQLENLFIRNHVPIHNSVFQILTDKFSKGRNDGKVNYEDLLAYLDKFTKTSKEGPRVPQLDLAALGGSLSPRSNLKITQREHPLTLPPTEVSPRDNLSDSGRSSSLQIKRAFANREDAQLKIQLEQMFKSFGNRVSQELGILKKDFQEFDKYDVSFIKQEQLRHICFRCALPFNDSLLTKLINRLGRSSTEKVNWKEFMSFLEDIVPATMLDSRSSSQQKHKAVPEKPVWETRQPLQSVQRSQRAESSLADQDDLASLKSPTGDPDIMEQGSVSPVKKRLDEDLREQGFCSLIQAAMRISEACDNSFISSVDAAHLIKNHNLIHKLGFSDKDILKALTLCTKQSGSRVCVKHMIELLQRIGSLNMEDWIKKLLLSLACERRYPVLSDDDY